MIKKYISFEIRHGMVEASIGENGAGGNIPDGMNFEIKYGRFGCGTQTFVIKGISDAKQVISDLQKTIEDAESIFKEQIK